LPAATAIDDRVFKLDEEVPEELPAALDLEGFSPSDSFPPVLEYAAAEAAVTLEFTETSVKADSVISESAVPVADEELPEPGPVEPEGFAEELAAEVEELES
jgi:hypothetical protein